jgi:plastocyanin
MRRVRRPSLAVLVIAVLGFGVAACGSSGGGGGDKSQTLAATNGKVTITAHDISFGGVNKITAPAGPLEVTLVNDGASQHTFTIDKPHLDIVANGGQTKSGSVTFAPGTYTFYCKVPGHRAQGMQGQLVVS